MQGNSSPVTGAPAAPGLVIHAARRGRTGPLSKRATVLLTVSPTIIVLATSFIYASTQ